jgi:hypothetical protein
MNGGYVMRAALGFNADFSGMASITNAVLYFKVANSNDGVKNGYTRDTHGTLNTGNLKFSRITKSWSEGTYGNDEIWNGSNSTEWSTFATGSTNAYINTTTGITTSGEATLNSGTTTRGASVNYLVSDIVRAWAPTSVTGGGGATNYGILIRMATEVAESTGDFIEFYSKQAYAYSSVYGAGTAGTSTDWVGGVNGAASYIAVTYTESAPVTPTVTITSPSASGIAPITNLSDAREWDTTTQYALPKFTWSTSGGTGSQTAWRLKIYSNSSKTTTYYNSGKVVDAEYGLNTNFSVPANADAPSWLTSASGYTGWQTITGLVNGTAYWWTIEVWDSANVSSTESSTSAFKVRWGQAIYGWDANSTSSGQWAFDYSPPPSNTQAAVLYRATSTISATTGTWGTDLGSLIGTQRYLQTLVRLSSDDGTKPYITDMTFTYNTSAVPPDNWTTDTGTLVLDSEQHRFGTKSALWKATGTGASFIQPNRSTVGATAQYDVSVIPNTRYTMSAYVKPVSLSGRSLKLRVYRGDGYTQAISYGEIADVNGTLGSANYASFTPDAEGWYRITYTFVTPVGVIWVKPTLHLYGTGSIGDSVYVDGAQFEEGSVVRSWTPGFVTQAVTYEGAGIVVDASKGGNLRLRGKGSTAGAPTTRDVIEIGANGLDFGGASPASLYSGSASTLNVTGDLSVTTAIRTATGGADPAVYVGDDSLIFDADIADTMGIQGQQTAANGGIVFGSGKDTNIYRSAANTLKTDDKFVATGDIASSGSIGFDGALYASSSLSGLSLDLAGTNGRQWQFGGADIKVSLSGTQPGCLIVKSLPGAPTTTVNGTGTQDVFADVVTNGGTALDNTNTRFYVYSAGGWKYAALTTPSDSRLKEEITEISGAIDTLRQLIPVAFKWKAPHLHERTDSVADNGTRLGFIADQVATTDLKHWVEAMNINGEEAEIATGSEEETTVLAVNIPQNEMEALLVRALLDIDTRLKEIEAKL